MTVLPQSVGEALQRHLANVTLLHEEDLAEGYGKVYLPYALACTYPHVGMSWVWPYVLPASKRSIDPQSGIERRHHVPLASIDMTRYPRPDMGDSIGAHQVFLALLPFQGVAGIYNPHGVFS